MYNLLLPWISFDPYDLWMNNSCAVLTRITLNFFSLDFSVNMIITSYQEQSLTFHITQALCSPVQEKFAVT